MQLTTGIPADNMRMKAVPIQASIMDYQSGKRCSRCNSTGPWVFKVHARLISYYHLGEGFKMNRTYYVRYHCQECDQVNEAMTKYVLHPGPLCTNVLSKVSKG